jgi:hypothetical protein
VQPIGDGGDAGLEIRAGLVHLVDEADARHMVLVGLAPDGLALCLDPFLGIEDRDGTPSSTRRLRSTSAVKSTWPGVSIRLMVWSFHGQLTAAE